MRCAAAASVAYVPQRKQEFETPLLVFVHSVLRLCDKPADYAHLVSLCGAYSKLTGEAMSPDEVAAEATLNGGESLLRRFVAASKPSEFQQSWSRTSSKGSAIETSPRQCSTRRGIRPGPRMRRSPCGRSWTGKSSGALAAAQRSASFFKSFDLRQKTSPAGANDVQCLTIHLAKGKEFRHVYLMGLAEEQLPSYYAVRDGAAAIEEERRNCFVAITRAQETLTLTYAREYAGYAKRPSRFLAEMGATP